jgi:hypothetical protein
VRTRRSASAAGGAAASVVVLGRWGEAPRLPLYKDRKDFTAAFRPLDAKECAAVTRRLKSLLAERYGELALGGMPRSKKK